MARAIVYRGERYWERACCWIEIVIQERVFTRKDIKHPVNVIFSPEHEYLKRAPWTFRHCPKTHLPEYPNYHYYDTDFEGVTLHLSGHIIVFDLKMLRDVGQQFYLPKHKVVVDHMDGNKSNLHMDNIRAISHDANTAGAKEILGKPLTGKWADSTMDVFRNQIFWLDLQPPAFWQAMLMAGIPDWERDRLVNKFKVENGIYRPSTLGQVIRAEAPLPGSDGLGGDRHLADGGPGAPGSA